MSEPGVCPLAVWRPTENFGYPKGKRDSNEPRFFVDHVMAGYKRTMDQPGWFPSAGNSVHFAIGRDGSISQYVRIQDAAWGNGLTGAINGSDADRTGINRFDRGNHHLAALERMPGAQWNWAAGARSWALNGGGRSLPNCHSISTEHEDEAKGGHIPWTEEMYQADLAVKRWCIEEVSRLGLPPLELGPDLLVGHGQIDPVNRVNCPGSAWPKARLLADLSGGSIVFHSAGADDVYNKQDIWVKSFGDNGGLQIAGGASKKVNARAEFGWPREAKAGELELLLAKGYVVVKHGDGSQAGRVGFGVPIGSPSYGLVRIVPDADGLIELFAEDPNNPVQFFTAHAVAYWS